MAATADWQTSIDEALALRALSQEVPMEFLVRQGIGSSESVERARRFNQTLSELRSVPEHRAVRGHLEQAAEWRLVAELLSAEGVVPSVELPAGPHV